MARFNQRLAAGVGVFAAFLLLGGSATVAVADPGRSHSDRDNSSDRGNGVGNGRGGSEPDDGDWGSNGDSGKLDEGDEWNGSADPVIIESPQVRVGSGRTDVAELAPSIASDSDGSSPSGSRLSESASSVFGGAPARSGSGSGHAAAPIARFEPPDVTVGNGRTPGTHRRAPEPQWQAPSPQPAPAAPPPPPPPPAAPAPPPAWANRISTPPVLTQQLGVADVTDWSNPLWGLAGLLLIPVAGAALGYRQARAAHAAERLRRS